MALLYQYNGSQWNQIQEDSIEYEWTFIDRYGQEIVGTNLINRFPNNYNSQTGKVTGRCLYIDGNTVNNRITANVKVTLEI